MKQTLITFFVILSVSPSAAEKKDHLGFHASYDYQYGETATVDHTGHIGASLRALEYTPFELRGNYHVRKGLSAELRLHALYTNYFTIHILDLGAYFPTGHGFFFRQDIERSVDFTAGAGIDLFVWKGLELSLSVCWRAPNPFEVAPDTINGDYTRSEESPETRAQPINLISPQTDKQDIVSREVRRYEMRADFLRQVYADAMRSPMISFSFGWRF